MINVKAFLTVLKPFKNCLDLAYPKFQDQAVKFIVADIILLAYALQLSMANLDLSCNRLPDAGRIQFPHRNHRYP